jgi:5-aminolevulinate synthase
MIDIKPFQQTLEKLKQEGKYRVFNDILRERGKFPKAIWYGKYAIKEIVNWCSNDYLGMGQNKIVIDAMHTALDQIIPDIVFVSDSNNHASIIQGIRHSGADKVIFKHNDMIDLEDKLKNVSGTPCIVFESVYSMDGDVSPALDICNLADQYGAMTYIDEVHAVGLYGEQGAGYLEKLNLQERVDIVNGTLGKAFGVQGGYIAGGGDVIDAIRSVASGFIFTTSSSPVMAAGALASIKYLRDNNQLRETHQERARKLKHRMIKAGLEPMPCSTTHIVPLLIGDAKRCKAISDALLNDHGIYAQPINYPTVPEGTERLRFAPTPFHTDGMIEDLIKALKEVMNEY